MNNRLLIVEAGEGTSLSISAPNGLKRIFFFFMEPESPEEARSQAPYKLTQLLFNLGQKHGWNQDYYESPIRWLVIPAIFIGLALTIFAHVIVGIVATVALVALVVVYSNRHEGPINEDRRWFAPVSERLTELAKANDFAGALEYSLKAVGR